MQAYQSKARLWSQWLGRLPGIMAIFLSGSLAQGLGTDQSDIDIFVIARPGRIWTARFWLVTILKLTNQLASANHHAGRLCPNHFITSDQLEIKEKNTYSAKLFSANQALYDPYDIFPYFAKANQHWVKKYHCSFARHSGATKHDMLLSQASSSPFCWLANHLETMFSFLQKKKILSQQKTWPSHACIVLSDSELRFHPHPHSRCQQKAQSACK